MPKKILILTIFIVAIFISAFHNHEIEKEHNDNCSICEFITIIQNITISIYLAFLFIVVFLIKRFFKKQGINLKTYHKINFPRAPPF